jgi:hypothetical protein
MTAVNRDAKTQATLIALARSRRLQRALAHAFLHRNAPLPTLRSSLGYMMSTARVTEDASGLGHRMTVLGVSRFDGIAYVIEDIGDDDAPIVYRLYLRGPRQGHMVPLHAWYDHSDNAHHIRTRIAALAPTLEPVLPAAPEAWMLSTRIIQRRALRVSGPDAGSELPIRKLTLQLVVEPVSGLGPSGRATATAFLRPQAQLTGVWSLPSTSEARGAGGGTPCEAAIARVTFMGIPSGTGLTKDTLVLLTTGSRVGGNHGGDSQA